MTDLITRLSKLDAPDREVDGEIWRYLMAGEPRAVLHGPIPKLTASVDAAIALARRVCDPAWIRIDEWYMGEAKPAVAAILPKPTPNETYGGKGANQAIALCIALLRAKEASKL